MAERTLLSDLERRTPAGRAAAWLLVGFLFVAMLTTLLPLLCALFSVCKTPAQIFTSPPTLLPRPATDPSQWAWGNWAEACDQVNFVRHFANTIALVGAIWVLQIIPSALAAYALSRLPTRFGKFVAMGFFLTLLVPFQTIIIPLFLVVREIDLVPIVGRGLGEPGARMLSVYLRVILPAGCSAFNIFVFKSFFDELPSDLIEAARLDGASERAIFWRIVLPLSSSIVAVVSIFTVINMWNDFLWPYLNFDVGGERQWTPIMVRLYSLEKTADNATLLAALVISTLPPMILFLLFQRRILRGVALTGLKG
jgi:multiple sugar transport system permease protein